MNNLTCECCGQPISADWTSWEYMQARDTVAVDGVLLRRHESDGQVVTLEDPRNGRVWSEQIHCYTPCEVEARVRRWMEGR